MSGEIELAAAAVPIATAAVDRYGSRVLARARGDVGDVTVTGGLRVLQRIFGRLQAGQPLPQVLADLVEHPDDADATAHFRLAVRRALEADPELASDVAKIVARATSPRSVSQRGVSGRDAHRAGRDMEIHPFSPSPERMSDPWGGPLQAGDED